MKLICKLFLSLLVVHTVSAREYTQLSLAADDLILYNPDTRVQCRLPHKKTTICARNGGLYINKKKSRLPVVVIKTSGKKIRYNKEVSYGSLMISYVRDGVCSCVPYGAQPSKERTDACVVKVLLDQVALNTTREWKVSTESVLYVGSTLNKKKSKRLKSREAFVRVGKKGLYIDGKKYTTDQLFISTQDNHIAVNGTVYYGALYICQHNNSWYLINYVPLEEYVISVLKSESWPGWPLEVNKAFAITSRTYVIAMVCNGRKSKLPYHIKNSNIHQTYKGVHTEKMLRDAVRQTKGQFLSYENKPITAMFDCCCGGIVPAYADGIDFKKAPYLARAYACDFCKDCKIFNWKVEYDPKTLSQLLAPATKPLGVIKELKISKKDKAGLVQEVIAKGLRSPILLNVKQLYSALKEVKSFHFSTQRQKNKIIFHGKGYGHHIGLCQWGAREMVRQGWDYKSILQFYYPGTTYMRLS